MPGLAHHGGPVEIVITGLDPVSHASFATDPVGGRRVGGRIEVRP
jgi:hypothetical protein